MQTADARKIYLLILLIGLTLNLALVAHVWQKNQLQAEATSKKNMQAFLEKLHSSFSFEKVYLNKVEELFKLVVGKEGIELENTVSEWVKRSYLPPAAFEIIFYNNHEPINVSQEARDDWKFFLSRVDTGKFRKFRISDVDKNRLTRFLNGGVGFERLEGKPGQLRRLTINDRRSYGVWFSTVEQCPTGANGMAVLVHASYISDRLLAEAFFAAIRADTNRFGYLNLTSQKDSLLPLNIDSERLTAAINSIDVKSGFTRLKIDGHELMVSYRPDGRVFLAIDEPVRVSLPFWSLAIFFFWFPCWFHSYVNTDAEFKLSLPALLLFVVVVSMALPMAAIAFYWNSFLESNRESIKIAATASLQQYLIQLDANYPEIFRTSRRQFRQLAALFDGHPENLQKFIDRSVQLEIDGMFDTCLMVNSDGKFVRPTAGAAYAVRRLVFHNRSYREKVVEQFFAQGWVPFDLEAGYAMNTPSENLDINAFVSLMPSQGKALYSSFTSFVGKDIIHLHNSKLDGNTAPAQEQVSSMVMSSFIGNDDESPVARIQQCLGDYFDFGFGVNQSVNYVDLIKDQNGRARYCIILFSGHYNYSTRFFEQIFRNQSRWPDGVKFMAISDRLFNTNYPYLDLWKRMPRLVGLMQPPRNMYVEETEINGKPHLLCAYAGKKCLGYILVAAVPLSEVDKKLSALKTKMFWGFLLVIATLLLVLSLLNRCIFIPARKVMNGVRALENRQHSHIITIQTGDEWQQLAETFNNSLESMKELEVAHFVQTCILPAADIISSGSAFAGRTVPADDVGGDYYDAFIPAEGEMVFVMGDVSGHSVSAALVVSMARAAFAAMVDSGIKMPDELFANFNQLMLEHLRRVKMMTCFAGHIDNNGILTSCNAGQTFPLLIREDGSVETLRNIGYPLGAAKRKTFKAIKTALPDQCRLVMFSDGVVEAMNSLGEPFGYDRFETLIKCLGRQISREDFFTTLYAELKKFSGTVPWGDDVTVAIFDYHRHT